MTFTKKIQEGINRGLFAPFVSPSFALRETFIFLLFTLLFFPSDSIAQTQKQWLKHAEKSFEEKDYYGASLYYREAMLVDSSNLYVVYKYAESLRMIHDYKGAERYYNYVVLRDRPGRFPEALFWMAMMKKQNGKYLDARKNFLSYRLKIKDKTSYQFKKTEQEIASCEEAAVIIKSQPKAIIYNLGDSLNSVNGEFAPVYSPDSTLFFSSINYSILEEKKPGKTEIPFIKIYEAEPIDSLYKVKRELDSLINSAGAHNANGSFDLDGNFYFSRCKENLRCELVVYDPVNNTISLLPESINLPGYNNTQLHVAETDSSRVLFFVSDRPGGFGGLDIWYSIKTDTGYTPPVNAGPEINTLDDEITPFYDPESKLLYFSSTWHKGLGGFDIFRSEGSPGSFSLPENAGVPINSGANDMYFIVDTPNKSGFLTSNRQGSHYEKIETCCNDIWRFNLIEEKKKDTIPVIPPDPLADLQRFIPIKLYFHNDEPDPRTKDTITEQNYAETVEAYFSMLDTYKEKYSHGLSGDKKKAAEDSIQSFFDHHVKKGMDELNQFTVELLKQLEKGYKLDLTVIGHASPLAKTDYNVHLTLRRISSLENYLREYDNGIFLPYLNDSASNGGSLKIIRIPFGEYKAEHYISDNLNDKKSSVYSIEAALNRNIEIVSLTLEHKDSLIARPQFRKEIFDQGHVHAGKKIHHVFRFKNTGNKPLIISGYETNCECIGVAVPSEPVAPGARGEIEVTIDPAGKTGKQIFSVTIISNGIPERKQLTVTAEIK